jgi:quercetin dioxygenase-like cupin family protein
MRRLLCLAALVCLVAARASAQDPVKVDPKHYKVDFENARVRVLHVQYGPHEKSVMHTHPGTVAVFLTDGDFRFNLPNGKSTETHAKVGQAQWNEAGTHLPENLSDKPFEVILVELKGGSAAKAKK